ncbi:MAG: hypothetical protein IJO79_04870, partial [Firmicutes bacterium]|nr:hypothetical protein [Bacillota bacterium]
MNIEPNTIHSTPPYQDGLFRLLFSDKEHLLELYNAVTGSNYGPEAEVEITTLDSEIFDRRKNDISFLLNGRLIVFLEQQSTVNRNMPLRFLLYCAKTYGIMVPQGKIYRSKVVPLPKPQFFVFYTGTEDMPAAETLHLSECFPEGDEELTLELAVKCFNISHPRGAAMLERSRTLQGYSFLLQQIRQERQKGKGLTEAINAAIQRCKEEAYLTTFLNQYEGEVRGMLFRYLNDDEFREFYSKNAYEDGHEDGRAEGREEGREEERLKLAAGMKAKGISAETICEITGLSQEE